MHYINIKRKNAIIFFILSALSLRPHITIGNEPIDKKATKECKILYKNLTKSSDKQILFGHQDDLAYGFGWKYLPGESDVKRVSGYYPAVIGHDIGHIGNKVNIDTVPFDLIRKSIIETYCRGGVNTVSWHAQDPVLGGDSWSNRDSCVSTVADILPGAPHHAEWCKKLDLVAEFFKSLKAPDGTTIPILFRPFHEMNGDWFWWGRKHCSPEEYKQLFRFTVDYLIKNKKVHNLIITYSPNGVSSEEEFMERYPGNEYVDIIGFDFYQIGKEGLTRYREEMNRNLRILSDVAKKTGKIAALTETGFEQIPIPTWWTQILYPLIDPYPIAYVLLWRNGRPDHYYVPFPGQISSPDFIKFCKFPRIKLQTNDLNLYQ